MNLQLTPEEREPPKRWYENSAGGRYRATDRDWKRKEIAREAERSARAERMARQCLLDKAIRGDRAISRWFHNANQQIDDLLHPYPGAPRMRLVKRIFDGILGTLGVSLKELKSKSRRSDITFARQSIAYWLRRLAKLSYPRIAEKLGRKDHTTIMHAVKAYPEKRKAMGRYLRPISEAKA